LKKIEYIGKTILTRIAGKNWCKQSLWPAGRRTSLL